MTMHNPPHPGLVVRRMLIDGAELSITEAAKALGVGRVTLSKILRASIKKIKVHQITA